MELVELPGPIGTEITGVAVPDLTAADVERLVDALDRRHLLLFRDQRIDGDEHVALCRHFGPVAPAGEAPYLYVSNTLEEGVLRDRALLFHSDFGFTDDPLEAISLHAIEMPAGGAPTVFADVSGVVARLEPSLRAELDGRMVVNVFDFTLPNDQRMREGDIAPGSPSLERRLIGRHPRTGAPVIQASALHTDRIVGLDEPESEALLEALFEVIYREDNTWTLDWRPGDLAIWDNIALQHHRPDFPITAGRTLRRVSIHDKTTIELVPNIIELLTPPPSSTG